MEVISALAIATTSVLLMFVGTAFGVVATNPPPLKVSPIEGVVNALKDQVKLFLWAIEEVKNLQETEVEFYLGIYKKNLGQVTTERFVILDTSSGVVCAHNLVLLDKQTVTPFTLNKRESLNGEDFYSSVGGLTEDETKRLHQECSSLLKADIDLYSALCKKYSEFSRKKERVLLEKKYENI